jgi:hypothetical protein
MRHSASHVSQHRPNSVGVRIHRPIPGASVTKRVHMADSRSHQVGTGAESDWS